MSERELREGIVRIGRLLWERGLVGASEGNISVRLDEERLLATPTGLRKGELTPGHLAILNLEGDQISGPPASSEIRMHLRIYRRCPEVRAVVHAHPPCATAYAVAGRAVPTDSLAEAAEFLGKVALVPFGMPGTEELPDAMEPFLADHHAFLLSNHGATTVGASLDQAYNRMEILERAAHVMLLAESLGGPQPIPAEALERLRRRG